ncbi:MAG TPA: hypothetical protein DD381_04025 [Lentisphaeria bacterium]|nr:MAG: hypothetical protein A2X47_06605 [Lentisphaerae bacterium GWF2_38_69]HBM15498.1 hypothetical protein [Lentisphaeria bacterium]
MESHILFILGWSASALVIFSLFMKSMMRMRWISLIGGIIYAAYGLAFGSTPLFCYNILRAFVNIHFLRKLYTKKDLFDLLHIPSNDPYLKYFLNAYLTDIYKFNPSFTGDIKDNSYCLFALRNVEVVSIVIVRDDNPNEIIVDLDYAIPKYRDMKSANFIMGKYAHYISRLSSHGLKHLYTSGGSLEHNKYLTELGYEPIEGAYQFRMSVETIKSRYLKNVR